MDYIIGTIIGIVIMCAFISTISNNRDNEIYMNGFLAGKDKLPVKTNGDKIRSMNNEELTNVIMCPFDTAGEPADIMPCVIETGTMELASPETCRKCMMEWLERKI